MSGSANPTLKLSRRQKLRQVFSSKPSTTQTIPSSSGSATTSSHAPNAVLPPPFRQYLLNQALQRLSLTDRTLLQEYTSSTTIDIHDAVQQAISAAKDKRKACSDNGWSCIVAGRHVVLREKADKVVEWLNRFKSIGDVAANADPVHVGLPWVGVRILLEAAVAESNQMAALIVGCEAALYMANRLQAHTDFLCQLPTTLPRTNLEESIVNMYAHVLQFLATAINICLKSTASRIFSALWKIDDIVHFEERGRQLADRIERDASNCDRYVLTQDRQVFNQLQQNLQLALADLQQLHNIQNSLNHLQLKIDLNKIPYAKGALFDSFDNTHTVCHPATRVDLLTQIKQWAQMSGGKSIYWLNGAAGAGKSTISWTVAQWLKDHNGSLSIDLGACFFFKRGEGDRGSAARFFPTIVRQLILKIPDLDVLIADVVEQDPFIFDKALAEQFRRLLLHPLQSTTLRNVKYSSLLVIVDALDECDNDEDIDTILQLWPQLSTNSNVRLRLFLTSRPDQPLLLRFRSLPMDLFDDIVLQDAVPQNVIEQDLLIYIKDMFDTIKNEYQIRYPSHQVLDGDWPGDDNIKSLASISVPLFIVAATICRFVGDLEFDPAERLNEIVDSMNIGEVASMDLTYRSVLKHLTSANRSPKERMKLCEEFRLVVGSIICLAEPLSITDLSVLLAKSAVSIERCLMPLHSVLQIPQESNLPIRVFHLSFPDFLMSEDLHADAFGIESSVTHLDILKYCLHLLSGPDGLRKNICNLENPGQLRRDVAAAVITDHLQPALQYASRYWVHHCRESRIAIEDGNEVSSFLQRCFLPWLEALCFMDRLSEAIEFLITLKSLVSKTKSVQLSTYLEDARRFLLANRSIIDRAPLQLYSSAIVFAPLESLTRKCSGEMPRWVQRCPKTTARWTFELQKLEGHDGRANSVAFSPDGKMLASSSRDCTVRLWNVQTGQQLQMLEGHDHNVRSAVFSPNGELLASRCTETIILWDMRTGKEIRKLQSKTDGTSSLAFSSKSDLLVFMSDKVVRLWNVATGENKQTFERQDAEVSLKCLSNNGDLFTLRSSDGTIQLYDSRTGQEIQKLSNTAGQAQAITFSPGEILLASKHTDGVIRIWDVKARQIVQELSEHGESIDEGLSFSHDGVLLASALTDDTVRIWRVKTGQEIQRIDCYRIFSMAFSPDGLLLAYGSLKQTIRLLELGTSMNAQRLAKSRKGISALVFSQDGKLVASALADFTIGLWLVRTGQEIDKFEGDGSWINAVTFSPDGEWLASASDNREVWLWEVRTGRTGEKFGGHTDSVQAIAFSLDGEFLATASGDNLIQLWVWRTGQHVRTLARDKDYFFGLAFSPDGTWLASTSLPRSYSHTIRLWDVETGREVQHVQNVPYGRLLKFNDDSQKIITDKGTIDLSDGFQNPLKFREGSLDGLWVDNDWIQYDGQNLLWLPHEYRGISAVHGQNIAIGTRTGQVLFFRLGDPRQTGMF